LSVVAVTGASGFIAGELVHQLLEKGYTVRGTVRNIERAKSLQEVFPKLQLYEADLLKLGSYDECFKGAEIVFHTASPFLATFDDAQKDLIDPALEGTKNVLSSIEKNLDTIKKVVVTSSGAAVMQQILPEDKDSKVWSEEDWNTTSTIADSPYRLSKYLAEKAAWDWWKGKEDKLKLCTVNPCFILGTPRNSRSDGVSISTLIKMLNGTMKQTGCPNSAFGIVDVRNVAQAHIACVEKENANGRYLLSSVYGVPQLQFVPHLKKHFPQYPLPETQNGEIAYVPKYSQEKTKRDLGIEFYSIEDTLVWAATGLIEHGLVEKIPSQ